MDVDEDEDDNKDIIVTADADHSRKRECVLGYMAVQKCEAWRRHEKRTEPSKTPPNSMIITRFVEEDVMVMVMEEKCIFAHHALMIRLR